MIIDLGNKYIQFELLNDTGKTQVWSCVNKSSGKDLGTIQWYGAWRQYTYLVGRNSEYNNGCLETILKFINMLNKEKRILQ